MKIPCKIIESKSSITCDQVSFFPGERQSVAALEKGGRERKKQRTRCYFLRSPDPRLSRCHTFAPPWKKGMPRPDRVKSSMEHDNYYYYCCFQQTNLLHHTYHKVSHKSQRLQMYRSPL